MIYRCLNCGGVLTYDMSTKRMYCDCCCSYFSMEMVAPQEEEEKKQIAQMEEDTCYEDHTMDEEDTMECKIYHCNSCGAQLLIDEVESATYCVFCGQPTVVFQRVDKQKRPKYIVPFRVTKELALTKVRQRINSGFFVPKEIKGITIDRVKGVYIPYLMADVSYHDIQLLSTVETNKANMQRKHFFDIEGKAHFKQMTVDTSVQLNDESARRLEPYEMVGLKKFDPAYLSGFYADCSDEDAYITKKKVEIRAEQLYSQKMKEIVARKGGQNAKLECSDPTCEIEKMDSVLLPAWFVVFHHDGESYTIMVNGQTGKVVGAVPFDKKKAGIIFAGASTILSALCIEILLCCSYILKDDSFEVYTIFFFCGLLFWEFARRRWKKYKYGQGLTKEVEIQEFSKKRARNE